MNQADIDQQVARFLATGGEIIKADSSFNKDANTRFRDTNAGLRYVDKSVAKPRQSLRSGDK